MSETQQPSLLRRIRDEEQVRAARANDANARVEQRRLKFTGADEKKGDFPSPMAELVSPATPEKEATTTREFSLFHAPDGPADAPMPVNFDSWGRSLTAELPTNLSIGSIVTIASEDGLFPYVAEGVQVEEGRILLRKVTPQEYENSLRARPETPRYVLDPKGVKEGVIKASLEVSEESK